MTSSLPPHFQVACGLILSLIRMSDIPTTAYYTSSRQYIARVLDEAAAQQRNTDSLYVEDGPTQFEGEQLDYLSTYCFLEICCNMSG